MVFWKNEYFLVFLIVSAWLAGYTLLRPESFMDTDTYLYLGVVCHESWAFIPAGHGALWGDLLSLVPCNVLAIKVIQAVLLLFSLFAVTQLGKLFFPLELGKRAGIFACLSPLLLMAFWGFEGQQFAIPLLFWSAYFTFKGMRARKPLYEAFGLGLVVLAGLLWQGAILWLLGLALISVPALLLFAGTSVFLGYRFVPGLLGALTPSFKVSESAPLIAFAYLFFLWIGLIGLYRFPHRKFQVFGAYLLGLGILVSKYLWMVIPFLAICIIPAMNYIKPEKRVVIYFFAVFSIMFFFQLLLYQTPTTAEWQGIKDGIELANGRPVNNFWGWTYWIQWSGGQTRIPRKDWGAAVDTNWVGLVISPEPYPAYEGKPKAWCRELKRFVWDCGDGNSLIVEAKRI